MQKYIVITAIIALVLAIWSTYGPKPAATVAQAGCGGSNASSCYQYIPTTSVPSPSTPVYTDYDDTAPQYYSGNTQQNYSGQNYTPQGQNFSLTWNQQACVGQTPTYTISMPGSSPSGSNGTINWTSWHNGQMMNQTTFNTDNNGYWSQSGNTWSSSDVGQWVKQATINGITQTLNFMVSNCGTGTTATSYQNNGQYTTSQPYYTNDQCYYTQQNGSSTTQYPCNSQGSYQTTSSNTTYYSPDGSMPQQQYYPPSCQR